MPTTTHPVRITVDPDSPLQPKVEVAGYDVSRNVSSYTLSQSPGRVPTLVLEGHQLGALFDGIAEVGIVAPAVAVGEAAASFLDAMDVETIQKLSLDAMAWLACSQTEAALRVMADLARGGKGKFGPGQS